MEQLEDAHGVLDVTLDDDLLGRLDEIFPGPGPGPQAYAWCWRLQRVVMLPHRWRCRLQCKHQDSDDPSVPTGAG